LFGRHGRCNKSVKRRGTGQRRAGALRRPWPLVFRPRHVPYATNPETGGTPSVPPRLPATPRPRRRRAPWPERNLSMLAFESVMAVVLLATPPDRVDLSAAAKLHPVLAPAVQVLAMHWELLDPRETKFMLVEADDFAADLKELQTRYQDLRAAPAA